jgi:hypothetical protein
LSIVLNANAGQGWYLLQPYSIYAQGVSLPDISQPLSQWEHVSSYDTAKECQEGKDVQYQSYKILVKAQPQDNFWKIKLQDSLYSRCISMDDSRLK